MPSLKLNFGIHLTFPPGTGDFEDQGPLFHKWLPDGERDAIFLTAPDEQEQLSVWFERRTARDASVLKWKRDGNAFDIDLMRRQHKLDGGVLYGELQGVVSAEELAAIQKHPIAVGQPFGQYDPGSAEYVNAGKRIAGKIQVRVSRFIHRLRSQYGQYWLNDLQPWDSRSSTLGTYCSSYLALKWWNETSSMWCRFLPTPCGATIRVRSLPGRGYAEYLTEADWRRLQMDRCLQDIGLGLKLLGTANEALDSGNWPFAFTMVITALEVALAQRVQGGAGHDKVRAALNRFEDQESLPGRAAVILLTAGTPADEVARVISAISIRNAIVHEGYFPSEAEASTLRTMMQTLRKLMQLEELKTPALTSANRIGAP